MSRVIPTPAAILGCAALLSGCATATQPVSSTRKVDPDCSFRSPTTCWTLPGRIPSWRTAPVPPDPADSLDRDSPPVLASHDRAE
jgi:hypothetical protein